MTDCVLGSGEGACAASTPATVISTFWAVVIVTAGGGIMAHPGGPAAGVASIREAWRAVAAGEDLATAARTNKPLAEALAQFGGKE